MAKANPDADSGGLSPVRHLAACPLMPRISAKHAFESRRRLKRRRRTLRVQTIIPSARFPPNAAIREKSLSYSSRHEITASPPVPRGGAMASNPVASQAATERIRHIRQPPLAPGRSVGIAARDCEQSRTFTRRRAADGPTGQLVRSPLVLKEQIGYEHSTGGSSAADDWS